MDHIVLTLTDTLTLLVLGVSNSFKVFFSFRCSNETSDIINPNPPNTADKTKYN